MSSPRIQSGYIYEANNAWNLRFYVHENGKSLQRSVKLCGKDEQHPSKDSIGVKQLAADFMEKINQANAVNDAQPGHNCPICSHRCPRTITGRYVKKEQYA